MRPLSHEQLRLALWTWRADAPADAAGRARLAAYRASPALGSLRRAARDEHDPEAAGLARTVIAVDALDAALAGRWREALDLLQTQLEAALEPHPLESALERFGARLALALGETAVALRWSERARRYEDRFARGAALAGVHALVRAGADDASAVFEDLADAVEAQDAAPWHHLPAAWRPTPLGFVPRAGGETAARAYVVTIQDDAGASLRAYRVVLGDVGDDVAPEVRHAVEVVLAFESDAATMLASLDPETLELRCVFAGSDLHEAFAVERGELSDVEVSVAERRLYLRLRWPPAWRAAGVAPATVWDSLEGLVLRARVRA